MAWSQAIPEIYKCLMDKQFAMQLPDDKALIDVQFAMRREKMPITEAPLQHAYEAV